MHIYTFCKAFTYPEPVLLIKPVMEDLAWTFSNDNVPKPQKLIWQFNSCQKTKNSHAGGSFLFYSSFADMIVTVIITLLKNSIPAIYTLTPFFTIIW